MLTTLLPTILTLLIVSPIAQNNYPKPVSADFVIKDFVFASGARLPEVRIHYRTLGSPQRNDQGVVQNAVLILHGTGGQGGNFIIDMFAGELFGPDQPLDAARYYIILPDNLGHGQSTRPSDGLRARFPKYGYRDMISAQHRLLTEGLKVNHLRLVLGTSMGGMHTWLWGQIHPDFMDALVPLASLPTQISGRNRVWRKMIADAIRTDPEWKNGEFERQPRSLTWAVQMLVFMSSNPVVRYREAPTLQKADEVLKEAVKARLARTDANDLLYAIESSEDYDPGPGLEQIRAPLLAINFADDLINPPELGVLEKEISRVKNGKAVLIPLSDETVGHGTHTKVKVWKSHLEKFMKDTEPR